MAYRHMIVASPAKIFTRNQQLLISREEQEDAVIPIEDLATLMLESHRITITNAALAKLSEHGVVVFTCNARHMPCGIFTAYHQHSRKTAVLHKQIDQSAVSKKRLWKQIVQQKLQNQAACLGQFHGNGAAVRQLVKKVRAGDTTNQEAVAAAIYFIELFGETFRREEQTKINAALNYGYTILRGAMARHVVQYGMEPALGIHHCNQLNAFNLVDDLMEPYRPLVDRLVGAQQQDWCADTDLSSEEKHLLYAVLQEDVRLDQYEMTVYAAMEQTVKSFVGCLNEKTERLLLPILE